MPEGIEEQKLARCMKQDRTKREVESLTETDRRLKLDGANEPVE